jgi:hypothetical protein
MSAVDLTIKNDKDSVNKESVKVNINMWRKFFTIEKMVSLLIE